MTDFSSWVNLVGAAHTKAATLSEKDLIIVKELEVKNQYKKDENKTDTFITIFDFDIRTAGSTPSVQTEGASRQSATPTYPRNEESPRVEAEEDSDRLPF